MPDGALYGSLILYVWSASVHRTVVNAFKGITNFKAPFIMRSFLEYKNQRPWSSDFQLSKKNSLKSFLGYFVDKAHLTMEKLSIEW